MKRAVSYCVFVMNRAVAVFCHEEGSRCILSCRGQSLCFVMKRAVTVFCHEEGRLVEIGEAAVFLVSCTMMLLAFVVRL